MNFISSWINVLTHPSVATFDAEKANTNSQKTLTAVIIAAVISGIFGALAAWVAATFVTSAVTSIGGLTVTPAFSPMTAVAAFVEGIVSTIIVIYLFSFLVQWVAKQFFGGTGTFEEQAYLISLYAAPLIIINAVLGLIVCIGWLIMIAVGIYALFLTTYSIQSGQKIAGDKSVFTWIIAGVITAVVQIILTALSGGWL